MATGLDFSRVGTKDVLAVLVVGCSLLFNGIGIITGAGPDAATMTLAGAVVGYYFKGGGEAFRELQLRNEPLGDPDLGDHG